MKERGGEEMAEGRERAGEGQTPPEQKFWLQPCS